METALLFGSNGFVGAYLAREFLDSGYYVVASDVADSPSPALQSDAFLSCNILDEDQVERVIRETKPDLIVNLAAISSVGQSWQMPKKTIMINLVGSLNVMEAAKNLETTPKILAIGSSEEYAPSDQPLHEESPLLANNPYGISKVGQEQFSNIYSDRYDMRVYKVRAFNHTGVGQTDSFVLPSFCKQAAAIEKTGYSGTIEVGNLDIKRDFSDVRDVVRAYRLLLESDYAGTVFNIGSGKAYSLRELLESIISNCSQDILIEIDPTRFRPSDNPVICCDNSKAEAMLGWVPQYEIANTLKEMYQHYLLEAE